MYLAIKKRIPPPNSHIWSLADQGIVSGSNFFIGIMLARFLGVQAFGAYSVALAFMLYANTFQASLVVSPMMTAIPAERSTSNQNRMLQGFFGYTLLVMLATLIGVQTLAWALGMWSKGLALGTLAIPLMAAMAAFQIQDWLRRALFVRTANRSVFFSDLYAYGGQLAGLVYLISQNALSAETALWTLSSTFIISAVITVIHSGIRLNVSATSEMIRKHWRMSRDYFASWQLQWVASSGVILIGTGMVGQRAAGAIRAAQNLLGPVNVLFQWMDNVVPVRAATRLRDWGRAGLVAYLGRIAWLGTLVLSLFAVVLILVDAPLIAFLYGEAYRPYAVLVVFQALYYLFGHGYRMVAYFHRALGNTGVLAHSSLLWAVVAVAFALLTVNWLAEQGIMLSLVAGEAAALLYLLWLRPSPREAGANTVFLNREPLHVVLRRGDGSPHLVLPFRNHQVMHSALRMYYPSRWTGRLYRLSLVRTLPWRARLGWVESAQSLEPWCPDLACILAAVPGATETNVGILLSMPGPRSKLTLKLMNDHGEALAYARIATLPKAVQALREECKTLSVVGTSSVRQQIPRLLAHGELPGAAGYFLVESAGPEAFPLHVLGEIHFAFLAGLVGKDEVAWSDVVDQVEAETSPLLAEPAYAALVSASLTVLRAAQVPAVILAVEHGDFAPWNIYLGDGGKVFVLDWEHARLDGLPWLDALHFRFQWEALVRRQGPDKVLASLKGVFKLPVAWDYSQQLSRHVPSESQMIMIYLLRKLILGVREGKMPNSHHQIMCCDMLELLLPKA